MAPLNMLAAGINVLGLKVPERNPVFLVAVSIHVLAALLCVLCGAAAALSAKGSARHLRLGRVYYWSLTVVFVTATTLAAMRWDEDYTLFIIGMIAITSASAGYLHRRLRRPGDATHITGMGVSYIALLTAFYVDNGKNLPLWSHLPHLAYWLLPSLVGVPILVRALTGVRNTTPGTPQAAATTPISERRHSQRLPTSAVRRGSRGTG